MPRRIAAKITAVAGYVPPRVVTNADLEKRVDTNDEWIRSRTGIRERHYADPGVAASHLGTEAAKKLLKENNINPEEIDLIVVATVTPDMFFPATACLIQDRLGAKNAWGFDLSAACIRLRLRPDSRRPIHSLRRPQKSPSNRQRRNDVHPGFQRSRHLRPIRRRRRRRPARASPIRSRRHPRFQPRRRRQRRPMPLHARRRLPESSHPRNGGAAPTLRPPRRPASLQIRSKKNVRASHATPAAQWLHQQRSSPGSPAPSQPKNHPCHARAPRHRRFQGNDKYRPLRQHHSRHNPARPNGRALRKAPKKRRPSPTGGSRRRLHLRLSPTSLGVLISAVSVAVISNPLLG